MSDIAVLVADNLDVWTNAVDQRSSSGRGSSKKVSLYGIERLRALILDLAARGKLVPQRADDEPAAQVLKRAKVQRATLQEEGVVGRARKVEEPSNPRPFIIPISWEWTQLAHIGHDWGQETPELQFTYVDVGAIDQRRGMIEHPKILDASDAPSRARKIVRKGTVIYSTVRPYLMNIAVVGKEFDPMPIASTAFAVIHPFSGVEARFLYHYLRSSIFVSYVESVQSGIAYPAINDKQFYSAWFPLPPLAEQKRIVAKVDELMALCDALERESEDALAAHQTLVETLLATLVNSTDAADLAKNWARLEKHFDTLFTTEASIDALKQTILDLAVRGKLVKQVSDEVLTCTLDPKYLEFDNTLGFEVPPSWSVLPLVAVSDVKGGNAYKSSSFEESGVNQIIRMSNLRPGYLLLENNPVFIGDELASDTQDYELQPDDVIVSMTGTVGKRDFLYSVKIRPEDIACRALFLNQRICRLRLKGIDPEYAGLSLKAESILDPIFETATGTANQANISMKALKGALIPVPPLGEQKRIVAKVDELMALCEQLKSRLADAAETQRHLADAITQQAVA